MKDRDGWGEGGEKEKQLTKVFAKGLFPFLLKRFFEHLCIANVNVLPHFFQTLLISELKALQNTSFVAVPCKLAVGFTLPQFTYGLLPAVWNITILHFISQDMTQNAVAKELHEYMCHYIFREYCLGKIHCGTTPHITYLDFLLQKSVSYSQTRAERNVF